MLKFIFLNILFLYSAALVFSLDPDLTNTGETNPEVDSLLEINPSSLSTYDKLVYYNKLAVSFRNTDPYRGYQFGLKAIDLHDSLETGTEHHTSYNYTGNIFFDHGYYSTATYYYKKALDIAKSIDDYGAVGYSLNDIGYVHRVTDNLEQALKYYFEAVDIVGKTDDYDVLAHTYSNISLAFLSLEQYDSTIVYARRAADIYKSIGNNLHYFRCRAYVASAYSSQDYHDKAISMMDTIMQEFPLENKDDSLMYTSLHRFSHGFKMSAGRLDNAIETAMNGLEVAEAINYKLEIAQLNVAMSETYHFNGDSVNSFKHLKRGIEIAEENGYLNVLRWGLTRIYDFDYFDSKDSRILYYSKFIELQNDYLDEQINDRIKTYDFEIEMAKMQGSNELLEAEAKANESLVIGTASVLFLLIILIIAILIFYRRRKVILNELETTNLKLESSLAKQTDLNNTKDKFFSIIAHDLKNPFGAFKQALEMLSENYDEFSDEEIKAFLYEISKSSTNLKRLLEDLLTWSQSQRGNIPFNPDFLQFSQLVQYTFESLEAQANRKEISLINNVDADKRIYADMGMLSTILRNLVSNAIKYTPENGRVAIYMDSISGNDTITIKDTGIGMDAETRDSLFKIGKHKSKPGTNDEKGTGLGLILTQEFVEKHNGKINIESEVGKGTTFIITFPVVEEKSELVAS